MTRRLSLAGQLLAMQVVIVCVVLIGVAAVTVAQSTERAAEVEGRRAQALAESLAASRSLRTTLEEEGADPSVSAVSLLRAVAESRRTDSGAHSVVIGTADATVLLVEHKMDVVRSLSDRIIVLHNGTLVADGEPAEVIASPVVQEAYLGVEVTRD